MNREFHPVANIFPLMLESEIEALANDIREHGLREPIWTDKDGKIIDGRNRFVACQRVRTTPHFRTWNGEGSLIAFVVSLNLKRRHLNEVQRAAIAAEIATMEQGRVDCQRHADGKPAAMSGQEAADLLNVSRSSVVAAKTILRDGTPEEVRAMKEGKIGLDTTARAIRAKQPKEQRKSSRDAPLASRGNNPARIQAMQLRAQIWGRLKDALTILTSLPLPADAVAMSKENDRTGFVDARIGNALNWLKEFSDEWSNRDQAEAGAKAGDHHTNGGTRGRAA